MPTVTAPARALIVVTLAATTCAIATAQTPSAQPVVSPPAPVPSASTSSVPSPRPTESREAVRADLGRLDALAQRLVRAAPAAGTSAVIAEIGRRWPQVRSELVGQGANRNDLIASDSAVRSLRSTGGTGVPRAANALTAAFAPIYPAVGDRVPARVHRLDYLHRSMMLDVATSDWVRANTDSISARSTWRAARSVVAKGEAESSASDYTRALDAVQDAIIARSAPRFHRAIANADRSLGSVEKALDTAAPPWRRFFQRFGF